MEQRQNSIYVTYDSNLKKSLQKDGIENILYGLHPKTLNMFWVYERNEKLNERLKDWFNE